MKMKFIKSLKILAQKKHWYDVWIMEDRSEGWSEENQLIINMAEKRHIRVGTIQVQGNRLIGVYCQQEELDKLINQLGANKYNAMRSDSFHASLYKKNS